MDAAECRKISESVRSGESLNLEVENLVNILLAECVNTAKRGSNVVYMEHNPENEHYVYKIEIPFFDDFKFTDDFVKYVFRETASILNTKGFRATIWQDKIKTIGHNHKAEYRVRIEW